MLDNILMYWVLPSLVTMLLVIQWERSASTNLIPSYYSIWDWAGISLLACFYPIGLIAMFCDVVWPWLIKERGK